MLIQRIFKRIFKVTGIIILILLVLYIPAAIKDSLLQELSQTQHYISEAYLRERFERLINNEPPPDSVLLENIIIMSLISATISFGFIFFFGFLCGWNLKKDDFIDRLWDPDIRNIDGFTFVPFPVDIRNNVNDGLFRGPKGWISRYFSLENEGHNIFKQREKNRTLVILPEVKEITPEGVSGHYGHWPLKYITIPIIKKGVTITTLKILIVSLLITFMIIVVKDYFSIENGFNFSHPTLNLFIDIFLIGLSFILGWAVGGDVFKRKFTCHGWSPRIVGNCICIRLSNDCVFICPQEKLDKLSIKYAKKIHETFQGIIEAKDKIALNEWFRVI